MGRSYEDIEKFRQKQLISSQLSKLDEDYRIYAGASWDVAKQLAMLRALEKHELIPESLKKDLELFKEILIQKKKAFFASIGSSEISNLGFAKFIGLGDQRVIGSQVSTTKDD